MEKEQKQLTSSEKIKKKIKWQLPLLFVLVFINFILPAKHVLKRRKYSHFPSEITYQELSKYLLSAIDDGSSRKINANNRKIQNTDNKITQELKESNLAKELNDLRSNERLYEARRELKFLQHNINSRLFLKDDILIFQQKYESALEDRNIDKKEALELIEIIMVLNHNAIEK